jgi:predicted transcriptional regulator with HTH domain
MIILSRGSGKLQRRILELLEHSPELKRSRKDLDEVLVQVEGFDPSNVLRAIKGLARKHRVGFTDQRHKSDSLVSLPRKARRISDDELSTLLAKIGSGR